MGRVVSRKHVERLCVGSGAMCRGIGTWLLPGTFSGALKRFAGAILLAWLVAGILLRTTGLIWIAVAAWVIRSWILGRRDERKQDNESSFVQMVRDLIGERNGVLLREILDFLHKVDPRITFEDLRKQCEELSIPIRDTLNVEGERSPGIHVEDLEAVWEVDPTPPPPVGEPLPHDADQH
jgi:hypothetical protein